MASHALRFAFFSLNWHMSTSCFCFEASKSAFLFLHNFSICAQISYIVDVSALVERANELEPPLLVATIFLWPKEKFSLAPRWAPNVLAKFQMSGLCLSLSSLSQVSDLLVQYIYGEVLANRTLTMKSINPKVFRFFFV